LFHDELILCKSIELVDPPFANINGELGLGNILPYLWPILHETGLSPQNSFLKKEGLNNFILLFDFELKATES